MSTLARVLVLAAVMLAAGVGPARGDDRRVRVHDNFFDPAAARVEPGDTVTWEWLGGSAHTVTASDGRWSSGSRTTGTFARTFDEPGTYGYYCQLHGRSAMSGVVQVGPPPPPAPIAGPYVYVPSDLSLVQALAAARPGTTVVLEPGVHDLTAQAGAGTGVAITTAGVTVRGGRRPADGGPPEAVAPDEVVVTSGGAAGYAFDVTARADDPSDGVTTLRDLTVTRFRLGGIRLDGAAGFRLANLRLAGNGWDHGVLARRARSGTITDVTSTGARYAAVSLQDCDRCDITVRRLNASGSFVGFETVDARFGIALYDSEIAGNASGVVVQSAVDTDADGSAGAVVANNRVSGNDRSDTPRPTVFQPERLQPGAGAGIWLAGAADAWVLGNLVDGGRYGIAVTALGGSADRNRIEGNLVGGAARADLAWDGVGANTCFQDNRSPSGGEPSADPPGIQALYPCTRVTVGVPNPGVAVDLALAAAQIYACEVEPGQCRRARPGAGAAPARGRPSTGGRR